MRAWACKLRASMTGLTPEEIALLVVIGLVLGVFPIMGFPTILCLLAAFGFRLNLAALQVVNNLTSPLQFALLLPLERVGAMICGGHSGNAPAAAKIGWAAVHAVAGWTVIIVPLGALAYLSLAATMRMRLAVHQESH